MNIRENERVEIEFRGKKLELPSPRECVRAASKQLEDGFSANWLFEDEHGVWAEFARKRLDRITEQLQQGLVGETKLDFTTETILDVVVLDLSFAVLQVRINDLKKNRPYPEED